MCTKEFSRIAQQQLRLQQLVPTMSGDMKCSRLPAVKWQHPHFAFLLWVDWTALSISFTFCLPVPPSLNFHGSEYSGDCCCHLACIWELPGNARHKHCYFHHFSLLLTHSFHSSKQLLKTLLTWFLKSSFSKHKVVRHQETNAVGTNISTIKSLCKDPQCCESW